MTEPLTVVGLDDGGTVTSIRRLRPGAVCRLEQAAWALELPAGYARPPLGGELRARPIVEPWPEN